MSVFDFPRINIKGLLQINVGTANNDDYSLLPGDDAGTYSGTATIPQGGQIGQSLRLGNSATVQPYDWNDPETGQRMTDEQMAEWMAKPQTFASYKNQTVDEYTRVQMIPGEWNLYGNMGVDMIDTSVVGVTVPDSSSANGVRVYTSDDPLGLIGAQLSFNNRVGSTGRSTAMLVDINPEAPQASQVFSDNLLLEKDGTAILSGNPSKAVTRWINFQRNTAINGPNGAAGTFQCTVPLSEIQDEPIFAMMQPYLDQSKQLAGIVFRYTMFRSMQKINTFKYNNADWLQEITDLYQTKGVNPTYVQISGTIAPWYEGEMQSTPTGSYLVSGADETFHSPGGNTAPGGGPFNLAPAIVNWSPQNPLISLDLSAALPDAYNDPNYDPMRQDTNPKFDLGPLSFGQRIGSYLTHIGPVPYTDTDAGDAAGWIFDYKIPNDFASGAKHIPNAVGGDIIWPTYVVTSPTNGDLLTEQRMFFASDQANLYADQGLTPQDPSWATMPALPHTESTFSSQGYMDTQTSFRVFVWGKEDTHGTYDIWLLDQTYVKPLASGPAPVKLISGYKSGQAISIPVDQPSLSILTIREIGDPPGDNFSIMTNPMINIRTLPNQEYNEYYTFENGKPVATAAMSWYTLYNEVFRNYYLLYPGMSKIIPLNDPNQWIGPTLFVLQDRIKTEAWNTMFNMARTRDVSATRRWLMEAYIGKFANQSPPANTQDYNDPIA